MYGYFLEKRLTALSRQIAIGPKLEKKKKKGMEEKKKKKPPLFLKASKLCEVHLSSNSNPFKPQRSYTYSSEFQKKVLFFLSLCVFYIIIVY